jgi:3'-5' exoribonuclease
MQVADAIMPFYPGLNRDLVVAGIFLHDIAKTWELCYDCAFGYTDSGQLVGHIVKSAIWIEHKAREAAAKLGEPIPQNLVDVMQHIILAHHGTHEFGSPRTPSTPEAIAVHQIENMDAKLMMSLGATRDIHGDGMPAANEGNWTEYMKAFSGKLYRPDVAPANAPTETHTQPAPPPAPQSEQRPPQPRPMPAPEPRVATPPPVYPAPVPPAPKPQPVLSNPLFEAIPPRKG